MEQKVYIHYGNTHFEHNKFKPITNRELLPKPNGGLWASPIDAKFSWKKWCEREDFRECNESNSFRFILKTGSKILFIERKEDFMNFPIRRSFNNSFAPDFEELLKKGFDAVELNLSGDKTGQLYFDLYGWDCDSIVIMNPKIIRCFKELI